MPTVLRVKGYRFFFFSLEGHEPPHVHVEHGDKYAKLWIDPVGFAHSRGFRSKEMRHIQRTVTESKDLIQAEME